MIIDTDGATLPDCTGQIRVHAANGTYEFGIGGFMTTFRTSDAFYSSVTYPGGTLTVGQPFTVEVFGGYGSDERAGETIELGEVLTIETLGDPFRAPELG